MKRLQSIEFSFTILQKKKNIEQIYQPVFLQMSFNSSHVSVFFLNFFKKNNQLTIIHVNFNLNVNYKTKTSSISISEVNFI